ncbi:MAG TPA: hypothetical protein PKV78_13040, partial [Methanoculleus thermophilus]|nr:hypothetical protein [Methanoculleus thermophilus]
PLRQERRDGVTVPAYRAPAGNCLVRRGEARCGSGGLFGLCVVAFKIDPGRACDTVGTARRAAAWDWLKRRFI